MTFATKLEPIDYDISLMNPECDLKVEDSELSLEVSWFDRKDNFHHFVFLKSSKCGSYTFAPDIARAEVSIF